MSETICHRGDGAFVAQGPLSFFAAAVMRALVTGVAGCLLVAGVARAAPEVLPPVPETMVALQKIEAASYRGAVDAMRIKYQDLARARPGDAMPRVFVAWCTLPSDDSWNQLKAIATIFPDNPWVRYGMGRIYTNWKGMSDLARTEFDAVIKKNPKFFPALIGQGDVARVKQDFALAEQKYRAALAVADDPFARAGLGLTLAAQQKNDLALVELKKAIAAQPEQPTALAVLVKLSVDAKRTLRTVAALDDKNPESNLRIAQLRYLKKDLEGAEAEWLEALARDPKRVEAREAIARLRLDQGVLHEALDEYRKALTIEGTRPEAVAAVKKLEADFKLPAKKAHGAPTNVYWAVQASLGKFFDERKLQKKDLEGRFKLRVRISKAGTVDGVEVLEDTLKDPLLLGHVYFGLKDAEYAAQKGEPVFEFELGAKKKGK